jgi:choice-of-anchor C domain-containing protein
MNTKALVVSAALAVGLLTSAPAIAATNFVSDGDFSSPSGGSSFVTFAGGSSLGAWTVTGDSVDLIGSYWQSPTAGGGSLDLDGNAPGGVTQTLSLGAGTYDLSFFLSGNPDGSPATKVVDVMIGGVTHVFDYTLGAGNSHSTMDYVTESFDFTATGPTVLSFSSGDASTPFGAVIGGVSVTAVPEPTIWATLMLGIGMIGAGLRSTRRKTTATAVA